MKTIQNLLFFLVLTSCSNHIGKIFSVENCRGQKNDFIYLVDSVKVPTMPILMWNKLLYIDELKSTVVELPKIDLNNFKMPSTLVYKDYGEIYKSSKFRVHIILRAGSDTLGRDNRFFIRTYTYNWTIIDTYELAIWNDNKNEYCFGSIDNKLIIERKCNDSKSNEIMQITKEGKIVLTSFHKPE